LALCREVAERLKAAVCQGCRKSQNGQTLISSLLHKYASGRLKEV